jgi:hypothetical protein
MGYAPKDDDNRASVEQKVFNHFIYGLFAYPPLPDLDPLLGRDQADALVQDDQLEIEAFFPPIAAAAPGAHR